MDKESVKGAVYYHLSAEEVQYLRLHGYKHITLWARSQPNGGRIIGTERSTALGRRNQRFLEKVMRRAGYEVVQSQVSRSGLSSNSRC